MLYNGIIKDISYKLLNPVVTADKSTIRTIDDAVLSRTGKTIQELQANLTITHSIRPSDATRDFHIQVNNPVKGKIYSFNIMKHSDMNTEYVSGGPGEYEDIRVEKVANENPDGSISCGIEVNTPSFCNGITVLCLGADGFTASKNSYSVVSEIFGTEYEPSDTDCLSGFNKLTTVGVTSLCTGKCDVYIGHFVIPGTTIFKHSRCVKDDEVSVLKSFLEKKTNEYDEYGGLKQYIYSVNAQDTTGTGYAYNSSEGDMATYMVGSPYVKEIECYINGPSCTMSEHKQLLAFVEMDSEYNIVNIGKVNHTLSMSFSQPGKLIDSVAYYGLPMDRNNQCTNVSMVLIEAAYGKDIPDNITSDSEIYIAAVSTPNRYGTYVEPTVKSVLKKVLEIETVINRIQSDMNSQSNTFADWLRELYGDIVSEGKINSEQTLILSSIHQGNESILKQLASVNSAVSILKGEVDDSMDLCNNNIETIRTELNQKGGKTIDIVNSCVAGTALLLSLKKKN